MKAPSTLLDLFDPPDGMVGHSAALVAMTATQDLLEEAMERFTGLRPEQRAQLGTVVAFLMLDPHTTASRKAALPPGSVPGLYELQPRPVSLASLLHAKLAILGFARTRTGAPVHIRVAVLTANLTYASVKQHLELAWVVDLPVDDADPQRRADVGAAASFVQELVARRFRRGEPGSALTARLDALLEVATSIAPTRPRSRFIHSLTEPLEKQIQRRFRDGVRSARNLLLCGSGFFENAGSGTAKPEVLGALEKLGVLTERPYRVLLADPYGAGALGAWASAGPTDGWKVQRAEDAFERGRPRRLHAKFVYAGYLRDGHASNGCLYLGSGNLSKRGLRTHGELPSGNVECGVVIGVPERMGPDELRARLFWNDALPAIGATEWSSDGAVEEDAPETEELISVPPILCATIEESPTPALRLTWRDDAPDALRAEIWWAGTEWIALEPRQTRAPFDVAPVAPRVRDALTGETWAIPLIDPRGRVCWEPPRAATYDEAIAVLLDFPIRPADAAEDEDDELDELGLDDDAASARAASSDATSEAKSYALHAGAELLESVAALQQSLPTEMLDDWIDHLDRSLEALPGELVSEWAAHSVDVLAHLGSPALMPSSLSPDQRARYGDVLHRTRVRWGSR